MMKGATGPMAPNHEVTRGRQRRLRQAGAVTKVLSPSPYKRVGGREELESSVGKRELTYRESVVVTGSY